MKNINIEPIKEGLKEATRLLMIAVLPVTIAQLSMGKLNYGEIAVIGIIAVLRGVEKYFYSLGKETNNMNPISEVLKLE